MSARSRLFAPTAALAASVALPAHADMMFNRVASFPVAQNLPEGADKAPTSSEIIAATEDGMTLVYSDSPLGGIGFIDITDAKAPKAGGFVKIDGEPTSVAIVGGKVLAGVNTSESKAEPSGKLAVVDLATQGDRGHLRSRRPARFGRRQQGRQVRSPSPSRTSATRRSTTAPCRSCRPATSRSCRSTTARRTAPASRPST